MALPTVTFEQYEAAGGTLAEDAFTASSASAHAAVREIVGFNEIEDDDDLAAYVRAVGAAAEVDCTYGASGGIGEAIASVTLGRFSASFDSAGGASPYDADMGRAIVRELSGSHLLYQGVG